MSGSALDIYQRIRALNEMLVYLAKADGIDWQALCVMYCRGESLTMPKVRFATTVLEPSTTTSLVPPEVRIPVVLTPGVGPNSVAIRKPGWSEGITAELAAMIWEALMPLLSTRPQNKKTVVGLGGDFIETYLFCVASEEDGVEVS